MFLGQAGKHGGPERQHVIKRSQPLVISAAMRLGILLEMQDRRG